MEQKIRFIFFIKTFKYVLLFWMCHFYSAMSRFDKFLNNKYGFCRKLDTRSYRLLGIYVKDIYPYVGYLELKMPYSKKRKSEKSLIIDNEKWIEEKKEKLYRSLLYKEKLIKQLMKNKNTMFHKSYNHYEKKIMNGLGDKDFFKKMLLINDKDYKKLKRKKYGLRLCLLLLLFILVLVLPIVDLSFGKFQNAGTLLGILCGLLGSNTPKPQGGGESRGFFTNLMSSACNEHKFIGYKIFGVLIYCLPIIILGIIIIQGIFYYYKNVIKQKKIKFLEEFNEW
ncbi:Plasmodium exported protein, unknown function [Plasmodium malariae]|uniref:Fam-l protein n=1 Tax=Plasmodium malariae TaxID=5858 RepID=A0A1D3TE17_PLAMA|nr:Plasmodium exported protein, unknown function [Plasmodium malariae]SCP03084.1 Plasmodium exported protein, unknown function [Plasmodium malariae]